jgi:hypothetical protein
MAEHDKKEGIQRKAAGVIIIAVALVVGGLACIGFMGQRVVEPIVKGPGVTKVAHLSDYLPNLKSTPAQDSEVYFLDSGKPGGSLLIYSSHPCEPSPLITAVMLIERANVTTGKVIVIPRAAQSGYEDLSPGNGFPERYHIQQENGKQRWFRFGGRTVAQRLQWPLPTVATHYPSGQTLADMEALNLNRCMPGRADGSLTERVAYAIVEIIKKENIDMVIDNHEAPPDRPLVEAVAAHKRAMALAAETNINMELEYGLRWRLEQSPDNLRGLSHREIGGVTNAYVMLHETASPMHGPLRGMATEELILTGYDDYELRAAKNKRVFCFYDETGKPLQLRVAQKLAFMKSLQDAWAYTSPDKPLVIENLPTYNEVKDQGIGKFLAVVDEPEPKQYLISKYLF